MTRKNSGFTLVELSIVLVVIALIIGGIVVGKSIISSTKLQGVVADVARYTQAMQLFKDKYKALPGDMPNAQNIWPTATDGDGDGIICSSLESTVCSTPNEVVYFWQDLALAGFIPGSYSGAFVSGAIAIGTNIPLSTLKEAGFGIQYEKSGNTYTYANGTEWYKHVLWLGSDQPTAYAQPWNPGLQAVDAAYIDSKMDDGMPGSGVVQTFKAGSEPIAQTVPCSSDSNTYNITQYGNTCVMLFKTGF